MTLPASIGARALKLLVPCAFAATLLAGLAAAAARHEPKPGENWITYKNARYGYSLFYPAAVFAPGETREGGSGQTFLARDGRARIVVFGTLNGEKYSPQKYRSVILNEFGGYDRMDYSPTGKTWFVLSGYRGENIYYQKVMFTCGNQVINVFSMTFPTAEKPFYEGLIEIMEDHFRPGRGEDTPPGCAP